MSKSKPISRRRFLGNTLAGTVGATMTTPLVRTTQGKALGDKPPNILWIMSDEHDPAITSCYGNRIVRTPNIDGLAQSGVTFDRTYCNSPHCAPSRLSMTAGKYIHRVGAWSNGSWLPSNDVVSLPRVMRSAGYDPILCGKMHFDRTRRYGYRELIPDLWSNNYIKKGSGKRRKPDDLRPRRVSNRFKEIRTGDSIVFQHDRQVTAAAKRFIRNRDQDDKPFFMAVGYLAPHFPLIVPHAFWKPYEDKIAMPHIPDGYLESMPLNYRVLRSRMGLVGIDDDAVRFGREVYYGMTQWLDTEIGKVLEVLRHSKVADNTVIVYTSDHGESLGEHGLWWKKTMHEQSARVPLIVSWPARWPGGQRRTQACSLLDLVQTMLELGGASPPDDWDGDSMAPWMDDANIGWKDFAVSQYYGGHIASGYAMARQGKYKYVYHSPPDKRYSAEREFYNIESDPMELMNLAKQPGYDDHMHSMHGALVKELGEDPDDTEQRCRAERKKGYLSS